MPLRRILEEIRGGPRGLIRSAAGRMWIGFAMNSAWALVLIVATVLLVRWGSFGFASARLIAYTLMAIWTFAVAYLVILRKPISIQQVIDLQVAKSTAESDPAEPSGD